VSEREKLIIDSDYYLRVTGELERAAQTYEMWRQTYPRDLAPYSNLGKTYYRLGRYEEALEDWLGALRLEPNDSGIYASLADVYLCLERPDRAKGILTQAQARKLDISWSLYWLAFLRGDVKVMAVPASGIGPLQLAETEAYHGRLTKARELCRRQIDVNPVELKPEWDAYVEAVAALWEAELGNAEPAKKEAGAALTDVGNPEAHVEAALALARTGDSARALATADELNRQYPLDTLLNGYWLPTIRAAVEISRSNPSQAIELLRPVTVYELAVPYSPRNPLWPVYVRGEAYLALRQDSEAAAEFQKILSHPGIMLNCPLGALAHLGLGRAYALQADVAGMAVPTDTPVPQQGALAKARAAYKDFLTLWKDADPDIPILKQAKAEYAKLR
jgi:tetratricopeptide (TPR) repeat protein